MLRITVEESTKAIVIKLEGRVAGPYVAELGRVWKETAPAVAQRKLSLDLRGTTFADTEAIRILREIHSKTGAEILAGTPWTQYLADEVASVKHNQPEAEG